MVAWGLWYDHIAAYLARRLLQTANQLQQIYFILEIGTLNVITFNSSKIWLHRQTRVAACLGSYVVSAA